VEDLEVDATPEDLMLSYVSGEKDKVKTLKYCLDFGTSNLEESTVHMRC